MVVGSLLRALSQVFWQRFTRAEAEGTCASTSSSGNRGGWKPYAYSKGLSPVDEQVRELCAYSTQCRSWAQEVGELETRHLRDVSRYWFTHSVCPLVCGWYPDDRLGRAPIRRKNSDKKQEENWGPWSEQKHENCFRCLKGIQKHRLGTKWANKV